MRIVHIAPEFASLAKVGGLADVVYGLSKALVKEGHEVEVILPKYGCIDASILKKFIPLHEDKVGRFSVFRGQMEGVQVTLLDSLEHPDYFDREHIYSYPDDIDRFIHFSQLAVKYLQSKAHIDVVHLHDWPCALIAALYKSPNRPSIFFTIHNLEHQGKCAKKHFAFSELEKIFALIQDPHDPTHANLLLAGIRFSDCITTVSPTYEKEILTKEYGHGLEKELAKHKDKLFGILNGIDPGFWDPETDRELKTNYSTASPFSQEKIGGIQNAKKNNRNFLSDYLNLKVKNTPLVACITRLVWQKGPKLIKHALERTLEKGGQFVLLGSTHSADMTKEFEELKAKYERSEDVAILLDKREAIAHIIYAAADMFVIPSIFEPCGLTQMIAMHYGTVPVVRHTGGLFDTVFDIDTSDCPTEKRNGFTFDHPTNEGVNWALDRALECRMHNSKKWEEIMMQGMSMDFSWSKTVHDYIALYQRSRA